MNLVLLLILIPYLIILLSAIAEEEIWDIAYEKAMNALLAGLKISYISKEEMDLATTSTPAQ